MLLMVLAPIVQPIAQLAQMLYIAPPVLTATFWLAEAFLRLVKPALKSILAVILVFLISPVLNVITDITSIWEVAPSAQIKFHSAIIAVVTVQSVTSANIPTFLITINVLVKQLAP